MKFSLGTDPEFFVEKNGVIIPYTQMGKINLEGVVDIIADNVLIELNTIPAESLKEFIDIHENSLDLVKEYLASEGLTLSTRNAYNFPEGRYQPSFYQFGCQPSLNLYGYDSISEIESNERFAGGHIHIGIDRSDDFYTKLISNCDYHIGLHLDEQPSDRRKYYGRAGEHRIESNFKVEYRTPSNDWLTNKEYEKIWNGVEAALEDTEKNILHKFDHNLINKVKVC